jgi:hypothetical protein
VLANSSAKTDAIGHALMCVVGLCPPGTFVRMDSDELGVVLRRSLKANLPFVAIVGSAEGQLLTAPRLHATAQGAPAIRMALPATVVQAHLNHYQILRLGSFAAELFA